MGTQGSKRSGKPGKKGAGRRSSEGASKGSSREALDDALGEMDEAPKGKKRGWREVEAWRERKYLRETLAEIWDDDPVIDESVFTGSDADQDLYTDSEEVEVEADLTDFDEDDESYYEEED